VRRVVLIEKDADMTMLMGRSVLNARRIQLNVLLDFKTIQTSLTQKASDLNVGDDAGVSDSTDGGRNVSVSINSVGKGDGVITMDSVIPDVVSSVTPVVEVPTLNSGWT
jgi:hypothetical protein